MAEVVVRRHVVGHPASNIVKRGVNGKRREPVLRPVVIDQSQEGILFAIKRRSFFRARHRR